MTNLSEYLWPWKQRELIAQFVRRELQSRYRQSLFGLAWLLLVPLLTLAVYTVVFQYIFTSRWADTQTTNLAFALRLFAGLSLFSLVSESLMFNKRVAPQKLQSSKRWIIPLH